MFTEEFQVDYYEMNTRVFDDFPAVQGEQVWNFADFATSQGVVRVQGNKKGPLHPRPQAEDGGALYAPALARHPGL